MATKKFQKSFKCLKSVIGFIFKAAKNVILGLACCLLWTLLFVTVFCWPAYIFWCIFAPKFAAVGLYGEEEERLPFAEQFHSLNGWIVYLLPFFWKKYFIEVRGVNKYSTRLQMKYYFKRSRNEETMRQISSKAAMEIMGRYYTVDMIDIINFFEVKPHLFSSLPAEVQVRVYLSGGGREALSRMSDQAIDILVEKLIQKKDEVKLYDLVKSHTLTDEQFCIILRFDAALAAEYALVHTPSDKMLRELLRYEEGSTIKVFLFCVRKYGLSPDMAIASAEHPRFEEIQNALAEFQQKLFVKRHAEEKRSSNYFSKFCKNNALCAEAQALMAPWQYKVYHFHGRQLDDEIIVKFLRSGDKELANMVFDYEPNFGLNGKAAQALVKANPEYVETLFHKGRSVL
jgi:hypothetical protein